MPLLDTVIWLVVKFSFAVKEGLVKGPSKIFVCEGDTYRTIWKTLGKEFKWADVLLVHRVDSDSLSFIVRGWELLRGLGWEAIRCEMRRSRFWDWSVETDLWKRIKTSKNTGEYFALCVEKNDSVLESEKCVFKLIVSRPISRDGTPNWESNYC
jgi:hypothetical protein